MQDFILFFFLFLLDLSPFFFLSYTWSSRSSIDFSISQVNCISLALQLKLNHKSSQSKSSFKLLARMFRNEVINSCIHASKLII